MILSAFAYTLLSFFTLLQLYFLGRGGLAERSQDVQTSGVEAPSVGARATAEQPSTKFAKSKQWSDRRKVFI